MIESVTLQELLSFEKGVLEPHQGLNVFSGPSGAGKSVLMEGLLAFFGHKEARASSATMVASGNFRWEELGIEKEEEAIIRYSKKEKARYLINDQIVTKKGVTQFGKDVVKYLTLKEASELSSGALLTFIDTYLSQQEKGYHTKREEYTQKFEMLKQIKKEHDDLVAKQEQSEQLKELALFECSKIDAINPKVGEDDELFELKKNLSRLDKFQAAIDKASTTLSVKERVAPLFDLLELSLESVDEALCAIEEAISKATMALDASGEIDPEKILDRLEQLGSLKKRYGSIEAAVEYRESKRKELEILDDLEGEILKASKKRESLTQEVTQIAQELSIARRKAIDPLKKKLDTFLEMLFLPSSLFSFSCVPLGEMGGDEVVLGINGVLTSKLSSGEFNRLRLGWMATRASFDSHEEGQVLFLDEIDANVSGEESHSVGRVLKFLAEKNQIFAISHQPQLTSLADAHFLVTKHDGVSAIEKLEEEGRIKEIARIISGEKINDDALAYARTLRGGGK